MRRNVCSAAPLFAGIVRKSAKRSPENRAKKAQKSAFNRLPLPFVWCILSRAKTKKEFFRTYAISLSAGPAFHASRNGYQRTRCAVGGIQRARPFPHRRGAACSTPFPPATAGKTIIRSAAPPTLFIGNMSAALPAGHPRGSDARARSGLRRRAPQLHALGARRRQRRRRQVLAVRLLYGGVRGQLFGHLPRPRGRSLRPVRIRRNARGFGRQMGQDAQRHRPADLL